MKSPCLHCVCKHVAGKDGIHEEDQFRPHVGARPSRHACDAGFLALSKGLRDRQLEAKAFDEDLFRRCPDLRLIRDLAEANKHGGELSRANVIVSGISGCGSPGGTLYTSTPFGMTEGTPKCTLQIDYEGGSRDMTETLTTAYKFLLAETS